MTGDFLTSEDSGRVRLLTINRPEAKNAMHAPLRGALVQAMVAAELDDTIGSVVLTAVDPVFSAGVDFKIHDNPPAAEAQFLASPARAIRSMRTPVVCAVNGACISGALEVALSCSFIIASGKARFADTHTRLGVVATWGLTALLPRAVGVRIARELSLTGRFVDAEEALRIGLVNQVVAHDQLVSYAMKLAHEIPFNDASRDLMDLYARGENLSLAAALDLETSSSLRRKVDLEAFSKAGRQFSSD
ncbi:enoyl-CoA hydratase [Nocardioides ginsengisegetis]|uniref:Enoyl-CoA hydratase n=1 Tax=Nocardioides ginsengisegetis TaxID=661491 RepID=A0A7W3J240_9ACTN|nr:enoyl-CoA hydratase-related protein [Nocardioides ginsengisegetis]MBA8804888.1 enoyl-CoA hydratase [Nocardioides ginsengisegetis]